MNKCALFAAALYGSPAFVITAFPRSNHSTVLDASVPTSPVHNVRHEIPHDQKVDRLREATKKIETYQTASLEAAQALAEIMDDELWTVEADSFAEYARTAFGYRRRRAYQLAKAGRCYRDLKEDGVDALPVSEAQIRPLTALSDRDDQGAAWERVLEELGVDVDSITTDDVRRLTQADVDRAVAEIEGSPRDLKEASVPDTHGVLSQRDRDYAAIEDDMAERNANPPSPALHAEHYGVLGRLEPADQAEVWARVVQAKKNGVVDKDGLLEAGPKLKHGKDRKTAIEGAILALADELDYGDDVVNAPESSSSGAFRVLIERVLLKPGTVNSLPDEDAIGGSLVVDYGRAKDAVKEAVSALDDETDQDIKKRISEAKRPNIEVQREMTRTRLEPEVAGWAWHVLLPDPKRSAVSWIPEADAPAPCYAPARLTQPSNTTPELLRVTEGDEPKFDISVKHAALLAPGVDFLHPKVPDDVITEVVGRARNADEFVFLCVTRNSGRLTKLPMALPFNVRPVVPVTDAKELKLAVDAFQASGSQGGLVFIDYVAGLSASMRSRIQKYAAAAIVRGEHTSQDAYDSILALRRKDFGVQISPEVKRQPRDTPFKKPKKPALLPGAPGSGISPVG